jgi:hypothetical protein
MGLIRRLNKADWLAELQWALVAAIALTGLGIGLSTIAAMRGSSVDAEVAAAAVPTIASAAGIDLASGSVITVEIADPSAGQRIWAILTELPTTLIFLCTLSILLMMVHRSRRDHSFSDSVVRSLRNAAVVVTIGGLAASLLRALASFQLSRTIGHSGGAAQWAIPLPWLLLGIGLLAGAEVIKRGITMRAELDTVI